MNGCSKQTGIKTGRIPAPRLVYGYMGSVRSRHKYTIPNISNFLFFSWLWEDFPHVSTYFTHIYVVNVIQITQKLARFGCRASRANSSFELDSGRLPLLNRSSPLNSSTSTDVTRAILINRLLARIRPEAANIAYFYCARRNAEPEGFDVLKILRCLVKQLSCSADRSSLLAPARAIYEKKKKATDSGEPGRLNKNECIGLILNLLEIRPAFIVLDAVDECDLSTRNSLLQALSKIVSKSRQPVKIAISSRQESDIQRALSDWSNFNLSERDNSNAVSEYVRAELWRAVSDKRLLGGHISELLIARIFTIVVSNAQGM